MPHSVPDVAKVQARTNVSIIACVSSATAINAFALLLLLLLLAKMEITCFAFTSDSMHSKHFASLVAAAARIEKSIHFKGMFAYAKPNTFLACSIKTTMEVNAQITVDNPSRPLHTPSSASGA